MKKNDHILFRHVGSCRQPSIICADDMKKIIELDSALWAVNSIPNDAIVADSEFLKFLDTDANGRIRPDELRNALKWLLGVLKNYSNIDAASDVLELDFFNDEHPDSAMLKSSFKLILNNMNLPEDASLTLAQLRNTASIIGAGNSNGDGIVTLENTADADLARIIGNIMKICGTKTDLSTLPGIDTELLDEYLKRAAAQRDWLKAGIQLEMDSVYKEKAGDFFKSYQSVMDKLNEYFMLCGALTNEDEERFGTQLKIDPQNIQALQEFIQNAPAAQLSAKKILDMTRWVNPLCINALADFMHKAFEAGAIANDTILTQAEWNTIVGNFSARLQWNATGADEKFAGMTVEDIELDLDENTVQKLRSLIEHDRSVSTEIKAVETLRKLALYQKYMLKFVNNFVSLAELFNPNILSMVQPGYVIMDGRYFTLNVCVNNLAEHKKIIQRSNICVMYLALETTVNNAVRKMTIATAVTSGTMRNIFIGKCGIFYAGDGTEYDAKVIDFVQQPVSFMEALLQPFYSFGSFVTKQADKFFSTRSKDVESALNKQVDSAAKGKGAIIDPKAVQQTPAISGSMLLMGGGVGLAALGSSVAFIANSVQNVAAWKIVAVLFGIAFTISAPMMLVSIVKLMNRRVSDFFAAGGWAVNLQMRLSRKMGLLFTRRPKIPFGVTMRGDLLDLVRYDEKKHRKNK